jgi:hypothetical protein
MLIPVCTVLASQRRFLGENQSNAIELDTCPGGPSPKAAQDDRLWGYPKANDHLQ